MDIKEFRQKIRPIILSAVFPGIGFIFILILKLLFKIELPKLEKSIIAFAITSLSVLLLFPKVFKIPFGKVSISEFLKKSGLYKPDSTYKYILLGIILASLSLGGMLLASLLIGKYNADVSTITLSHAVFSLTPGIWEELLFRGVMMMLLIRMTKSLKKAVAFQVLLFGIMHFKGIDLVSVIDVFSVMIMALVFTYAAFKTRSLIPGMIFHYLHDTFLYFVQLPDGVYTGFKENAIFYSLLWAAFGLAIAVTKRLSERFNIQGNYNFYAKEPNEYYYQFQETQDIETRNEIQFIKKEKRNKRILLVNAFGFFAILLLSLEENSILITVLISVIILANILLLILWGKIKKNYEFQIFSLNACVAIITGYEFYSKGSKQVYIIWFLLGGFYFVLAFVKWYKFKSVTNKIDLVE